MCLVKSILSPMMTMPYVRYTDDRRTYIYYTVYCLRKRHIKHFYGTRGFFTASSSISALCFRFILARFFFSRRFKICRSLRCAYAMLRCSFKKSYKKTVGSIFLRCKQRSKHCACSLFSPPTYCTTSSGPVRHCRDETSGRLVCPSGQRKGIFRYQETLSSQPCFPRTVQRYGTVCMQIVGPGSDWF